MTATEKKIRAHQNSEYAGLELGRILEDSFNEIYIFDAETLHFILVNSGARQNLGYSIDELRDLTPLDLKPEYTLKTFTKLLAPITRWQQANDSIR